MNHLVLKTGNRLQQNFLPISVLSSKIYESVTYTTDVLLRQGKDATAIVWFSRDI